MGNVAEGDRRCGSSGKDSALTPDPEPTWYLIVSKKLVVASKPIGPVCNYNCADSVVRHEHRLPLAVFV